MKKILVILSLWIISNSSVVLAHPYHYHGGSCSSCATYIVRSDYYQKEQNFKNCNEHILLVDTTVNFYSNGSRRVFNSYSVLNKDGTILISDCYDIKHVLHNGKHYFLAKQGKYYNILTSEGERSAKRQYSKMKEIMPNKILVKVNKSYGIIDIEENVIVPIKYKEFEQLSTNLFKTKLNGYFGLVDSSNNVFLKNEYDKIKSLYETYIIKKEGKFGLVDIKGNIILEATCDKIKKMGEYIIVKKDKNYGVFDSSGKQLSEIEYKKVKLNRNQLKLFKNKTWEEI